MRAYAILSLVPDVLFFTADDEYKARLRRDAGNKPGAEVSSLRLAPLLRYSDIRREAC